MNTALIMYSLGDFFLIYLARILRASFNASAPTAKNNAERVYRIRSYKMQKAILASLEDAKFELSNVNRVGEIFVI